MFKTVTVVAHLAALIHHTNGEEAAGATVTEGEQQEASADEAENSQATEACSDPCGEGYSWHPDLQYVDPDQGNVACKDTWAFCVAAPNVCVAFLGKEEGSCEDLPMFMKLLRSETGASVCCQPTGDVGLCTDPCGGDNYIWYPDEKYLDPTSQSLAPCSDAWNFCKSEPGMCLATIQQEGGCDQLPNLFRSMVDSSYRPVCCQNPDAAAGPCAGMGVHFDDPEKLAEDPSAVMPCVGCGLGLNSDCASAVAASMSAAQVDVDEFDASLCDALATTRECFIQCGGVPEVDTGALDQGLKNCTELYLAAAQACTDPCGANYTWQASNAFSLPGGERESCNETWQYCKLNPSGCLEGVGLPKGGCAEVPQAMRMYSLGELGEEPACCIPERGRGDGSNAKEVSVKTVLAAVALNFLRKVTVVVAMGVAIAVFPHIRDSFNYYYPPFRDSFNDSFYHYFPSESLPSLPSFLKFEL